MSRAHGSAFPPIDSAGDAREFNTILRSGMGETDWSIESVVVGDRVHLLATCHCEGCRGIRDEQDFETRPQHRWIGKCSLVDCEKCGRYRADLNRLIEEDARAQAYRRSAAEANARFRRSQTDRSA